MTSYERAQHLLLLRMYLLGRRQRSPGRFADGRTLLRITSLLWTAYWESVGLDRFDKDGDDGVAGVAAFQRWIVTLWAHPPIA